MFVSGKYADINTKISDRNRYAASYLMAPGRLSIYSFEIINNMYAYYTINDITLHNFRLFVHKLSIRIDINKNQVSVPDSTEYSISLDGAPLLAAAESLINALDTKTKIAAAENLYVVSRPYIKEAVLGIESRIRQNSLQVFKSLKIYGESICQGGIPISFHDIYDGYEILYGFTSYCITLREGPTLTYYSDSNLLVCSNFRARYRGKSRINMKKYFAEPQPKLAAFYGRPAIDTLFAAADELHEYLLELSKN